MKHFILTLIAIFMLNGCSVANLIRMKNANDDIKPEIPVSNNAKFEQTLRAFYIGEKPYIKVTVNESEELLFLIDTGASFSMLFDTQKASNLKLERGYSLEIRGWGEQEHTPAYQTQLASMAIGDVIFRDINVAYIPLSTTQYYLTPDEAIFDGVLGHDVLKHFNWQFDKHANAISIKNTPYSAMPGDINIPIDVFFSKLMIPIKIKLDGREFEQDITIDTGSRSYLKLSSAYIENYDIKLPAAQVNAADYGLSGETKHIRFRLPELHLDELKLTGVKTNVIKADDEDDFWVIGSALLNQFVTIIDYQNNLLTIRPYKNTSFASRYNLAGLDLRKLQNGMLLVRQVFPNLIAHQKGLTPGAIVTSINDIDSRDITERDWIEMVSKPNTFKLCFDKKPCQQITTQHFAGYSTNLN